MMITAWLLAWMWMTTGLAGASELVRELAAGRARKVVVYGTSLTAAGGWVGQMGSWLTSTYAGKLTLINSGMGAKNSDWGLSALASAILAHDPDTVIIEFAMNDAYLYTNGTPLLTVAHARENLESMISQIRAQNPRVEIILQTMNSVWDSPTGLDQALTLRPNLPAYYQMYRDVAAQRGLLLIDHHSNWVALQNNYLATFQAYIPDGTHPTYDGTLAVVLPLLKSRLIGTVDYLPAAAPAPSLTEAEVCVYGGTSAAVAAAVQAARLGKRVVLLSPDPWLGGLSSNGLGWTDIGSPDVIGGVAREFYHRVYNYYLDAGAWTAETRSEYLARSSVVPDVARQMMFTFEPRVARRIFEDMVAESGVTVMRGRLQRGFGGVKRDGRRIREICTDDGQRSIRAAMFIDATGEGDLMAAAGVSYTVGREANSVYGETSNGIQSARATNYQLPLGIDPYVVASQPESGLLPGVNATAGGADGAGDLRLPAGNFRMCLTDLATNRLPVPQPPGYQESDYELLVRAIAAGQTSHFFKISPLPNRKTDSDRDGGISTDFVGGNYDLAAGSNYAEASDAQRAEIVAAHLRYQQGFVWTLQNSARVPETIRAAWAQWGLPRDEFMATGGWPGMLNLPEGRRMVSDFVLTEQHVNQAAGYAVADPIGLAGTPLDLHHTQRFVTASGVQNEGGVPVAPASGVFGIPLRAIIPRVGEVENLLVPVSLSESYIALGSVRTEPVSMILGQSSGAAAARAINDGVSVQQVDYAALRRDLLVANQILPAPPPSADAEIIVDNGDLPLAAIVGGWTSGALAGAYHGGYLHDGNTSRGTKSVTFSPPLPAAGTYQVFARWTAFANRATNARFDVVHADGITTVLCNQRLNDNAWVSLGGFRFQAGTVGSVVVRNDNADGYVIADAVRFTTAPPTEVSISASVPTTTEGSSAPGMLSVSRAQAGASPLVVRLAIAGTATPGVDYKALSATVTIPAGRMSGSISVQAFADPLIEDVETVTATIVPDLSYRVSGSGNATVTIADPPFDRWKATHFTPEERADPQFHLADHDHDGAGNLIEYSLGTDPHVADSPASALIWREAAVGSELRLYYRRAAKEVTYEVQQSSSLDPAAWTHAGVSPETYEASSGLFFQSVPVSAIELAKYLRLRIVGP